MDAIQVMDEQIERYKKNQDIVELTHAVTYMAELPYMIDLLERIYYDPDLLKETTHQSKRLDLHCIEVQLHRSEPLDYRLCLQVWENEKFHRLGGSIATHTYDWASVILLGNCRVVRYQPDILGPTYYRYRCETVDESLSMRFEERENLSLVNEGILQEGSSFSFRYEERCGVESENQSFTALLTLQGPTLTKRRQVYYPVRLPMKPSEY